MPRMSFAVIPGSRNVDHIRDNMNILDFTLTDEALAGFAGWRPAFEQK